MPDSNPYEIRNRKGKKCALIILSDDFEVFSTKADGTKDKKIDDTLHTCADPRNPQHLKDKLNLADHPDKCRSKKTTTAIYSDGSDKREKGFHFTDTTLRGGGTNGADWEAIDTGGGFPKEKR